MGEFPAPMSESNQHLKHASLLTRLLLYKTTSRIRRVIVIQLPTQTRRIQTNNTTCERKLPQDNSRNQSSSKPVTIDPRSSKPCMITMRAQRKSNPASTGLNAQWTMIHRNNTENAAWVDAVLYPTHTERQERHDYRFLLFFAAFRFARSPSTSHWLAWMS